MKKIYLEYVYGDCCGHCYFYSGASFEHPYCESAPCEDGHFEQINENDMEPGKFYYCCLEAGEENTPDAITEKLTKREIFAAVAMHGIVSNPEIEKHGDGIDSEKWIRGIVKASVYVSDALLEALNAETD